MNLNYFIFPKPNPSYNISDFSSKLIWIPKKSSFSYKEKIRYCESYGSNLQTHNLQTQTSSCRNLSMRNNQVQQIPKILFSFENKFQTSKSSSKDILKESCYNTCSIPNIERETESEEITEHIPCMYINNFSNIIGLYFHANNEDLGESYELCREIAKYLKINILAIEYPGYGVYKTKTSCASEELIKDAVIVYKFLTELMNISEQSIVLFGRCMGSGPAVHLASMYKPSGLFLISAFLSIKNAAQSMFSTCGLGWLVKSLVSERFMNKEIIGKVKCPILFIHGKKDEIISWEQSLELLKCCKAPAKLVTPENMTHNNFNLKTNIILPMLEFMRDALDQLLTIDDIIDYSGRNIFSDNGYISFPTFMFSEPAENQKKIDINYDYINI